MKNHLPLLVPVLAVLFFMRCQNEQTTHAFDQQNDAGIAVRFEVLSNAIASQPRYRSAFTLTNHRSDTLHDSGWAMYFNQTNRHIVEGSIRGKVQLSQLSGDFYEMKPAAGFKLSPEESTTITFEGSDWMIKEVDAPAGLYFNFSSKGEEDHLKRVADYTIVPFSKPEQYNRFTIDKVPVPTPESCFKQNEKLKKLGMNELPPLLPSPVKVTRQKGNVELNPSFEIHYQKGLEAEARFLQSDLKEVMGVELKLSEGAQNSSNSITLKLGNTFVNGTSEEAYQLSLSAKGGIEIKGTDTAGIFYGIQSLRALLPVRVYHKNQAAIALNALQIQDAPRFHYRGFHLDVARNFHKKEAVLKLMDLMAFYKLNKFHFHMSDDEGWRLEIEDLPELTAFGSRRGHTLTETSFLHPSYGSGPFPDAADNHGSGYYSKNDFIEILKYATARHIEVITEIESPGHARAAIKSMLARYRRLMKEGNEEAAKMYLLNDLNDQSDYRSVQDYDDNVLCPCQESTYRFLETVVDNIRKMYAEAGASLTTIHMGGDEVPGGVWEKSPACEKLIRENPTVKSAADIPYYFLRRFNDLLLQRKLKTGGWEEVAMKKDSKAPKGWIPNPEFTSKKLQAYVWQNLWGNQDLANKLANAGYNVVLCNVTNFYFDLAYNKDPKEPGFYWGGFVNTRKAFEFIPFDALKSTKEDPLGVKFSNEDYKDMVRLKPTARQNILGLQGELWSETVKGQDMMEYYLLPKLLGLAERAWGQQPSWAKIENEPERTAAIDTDWNAFANALGQRELPRLDDLFGGFNYRIPPPGAIVEKGQLRANIAFPGLRIRFTTDGSEPTATSPEYTGPVEIKGVAKLAAFDSRGTRSRISEVQ